MLVSAVQQSESAICIHISPLSWTSLQPPFPSHPTHLSLFMNIFYFAEASVHSVQMCFPLSSTVPAGAAERGHISPCAYGLVQTNGSFLSAVWLPDSTRGRADSPLQCLAGAGIKAVSSKELFPLSSISLYTFSGDSAMKT